ncbi:MAG: TIGR04076 family protein [Candidatus Lokiarchaeota archaeon]|nr:TIGR04076 family protein [Candidatus Lokiarchaeota archaeon]
MEISMPKCKITVLKRSLNSDLIEEYIEDIYKDMKPCEIFKDGQEIIIDPNLGKVPDGFCHWAWGDIRHDIITIASGGNILGMKNKGTAITGCSDWFRPVIFKVERIE